MVRTPCPTTGQVKESPPLSDQVQQPIGYPLSYFGAGKTGDALSSIKLAIQLGPEEPSYYFNLSVIHKKIEDFVQAIEAIKHCMKLNENTPPDRDHLFQAWGLYRQTGDE